MANSDELRAKARLLYELAQRVDGWGERVELRFRAMRLEADAEALETDEIPESHVIHSGNNRDSA